MLLILQTHPLITYIQYGTKKIMNLINTFKKKGLIHLKNFLTEEEVLTIDERAREILHHEYNFIYAINKEVIEESFLTNHKFERLKNDILSLCKLKEFKINNLEDFIDIFQPLLKELTPHGYYLEKLHALFLINYKSNTDLLFDKIYSSIFLTNKFLDVYREFLGTNDLIYYGESHLNFNKANKIGLKKETSRGWHTDDFYNSHANTSEATFNIRGAVFYHSDQNSSGGTKFLPGSHKYIRPSKLLKKIYKKIIFKKNLDNSFLNTRLLFPKNIFPSKRDFILWDKRLFHSAWAVKIKGFSKIILPPFVEDKLMNIDTFKFLIEKNSFPRSLANLDFGRKSDALNLYMDTYGARSTYTKYWNDKAKLCTDANFLSKLIYKNIKFSDRAIRKACANK